jgi:hypothetical protein
VSGKGQGEEAFATVVIAVEESDSCKRETFRPEPIDGSGRGFDEIALVDSEGGSECSAWSGLVLFWYEGG